MKVLNLGVIALGISALTACGGGSGDSDVSSQPIQPSMPSEISIEAVVVQSKALVDVQSQVIVQADSDVDLSLTSVKEVNNQPTCKVTSLEGMTFSILSEQVGECQFEYTVESVEQSQYIAQASSLARVSVSETAEDNTLPNLSATTNIESPVTIDLSVELESDLDTSIYVLSEEVTLLGAGSVEVDSFNNSVTYTPTNIGVTRIMYSMSDGVSTKLGNIDVAVSDTGNTPPVATDYIREGKLAKDMSVEIDLTDYVSDVEDSVILDSVRAYNAETEITSTTEHTFMFQSPEAGPHEVAYTVTDGRGGYAVGQVYIEVEPDFSLVQDWEDITIYDPTIGTDITFTAPASKVLADYTNTAYTTYQAQDGLTGPKYSEVVTMNLEQAQNYCASRNGRLPITREWELLLNSYGNLFHSQNWPAGSEYWSADMLSASTGRGFHATTGSMNELEKESQSAFVTCVLLDSEVINDFNTELTLNDIIGAKSDVVGVVVDPDGDIAPYQDVKMISENQYGVFSNGTSEIELIADTSGEVQDTYVDNALVNEVISAYTSSHSVDSVVYKSAEITGIRIEDKTVLESTTKIPGHIVELNVVSVNLEGEESFVNNDFVEYSSSDNSIAEIVQNTVHILAEGEVTITASFKGYTDSYTQISVIPLTEISGGWIMQVGEKQEINIIYSVDNGVTWDVLDGGAAFLTSNSSVISIEYQGEQAVATGQNPGTSILSSELDLNGFLYSAFVEGSVTAGDWCYKTAISNRSGNTVCIGYEVEVVNSSIGELVYTYGAQSKNPYVGESDSSLFCNAFGAKLDNSVEDDYYIIDGTFGSIEQVTAWVTSSGIYDSTMYDTYLTLKPNQTNEHGVPICELSTIN
ncbi:hypothetical protein FCV44_04780 [Vibrio kanaloae]|uniref:Ig-like domain-containing protein n=1 Tax=Vibrio kanaloae TaxID=170673 RepID=UPI0010BE3549|nr:hypothetical protein [Vibrio kanaloae]TKE99609.1 hypothetical protein FCV44_04780 [Vibrio kanaloae]TKF15576.1 hypothetical protein FCV47_13885 [Vibrio kanaloae]